MKEGQLAYEELTVLFVGELAVLVTIANSKILKIADEFSIQNRLGIEGLSVFVHGSRETIKNGTTLSLRAPFPLLS